MAKRRNAKRGSGPELIAGQPMREVLEFLCSQAQMLDRRRERRGEDEDQRLGYSDLEMRFLSAPNPDAVVQELIAKGWVEKAPKKGREAKDRYQLTEAGRRLGEESAHLFKWPAAQSRIRPVPRYKDRLGCLMHLHTEVARLERGDPERELAPYQRALLRDS